MSCLHFDTDEIRTAQTMSDMAESCPDDACFVGMVWVDVDPHNYLCWNTWNHPSSTDYDHHIDLIDERFLEYLATVPEDTLSGRVKILRRDTGAVWRPGDWDGAVAAWSAS